MQSIRTRLTLAFLGAMIATIFVLAVSLYSARRVAATREMEQQLHSQADFTKRLVDLARDIVPGELSVTPDSMIGSAVVPRMLPLLDLLPNYVMIKDRRGYTLYRSRTLQALSVDNVSRLDEIAMATPDDSSITVVTLGRRTVLMTARRMSGERTSRIDRIFVAVPTTEVEEQLSELVRTFFVIVPFLLLLSVLIAHLIASRAFRPLDRIIDQVEAITDGRSLHRRLAIGAAGDELARLSSTLNAMIGRLEASFGALRRFTADASHELKTPLAVMRADVEYAMSPKTTREARAVALEEALQQITRMADLVDSLLTLARADEGRFDLHREPVDLVELVAETVETARFLGEEGGVTINVPRLDAATVQGDLTRLRQLFMNLVTNAIKYTPQGGRVDISLANTGEHAVFTVRDTGIGIAAADLAYVFERFWRADRVRTRDSHGSGSGGFGLGLAISQWIAQAHGGTLTAQSKLTRGSTFTVTLPFGVTSVDERLVDPPRAAVVPGGQQG